MRPRPPTCRSLATPCFRCESMRQQTKAGLRIDKLQASTRGKKKALAVGTEAVGLRAGATRLEGHVGPLNDRPCCKRRRRSASNRCPHLRSRGDIAGISRSPTVRYHGNIAAISCWRASAGVGPDFPAMCGGCPPTRFGRPDLDVQLTSTVTSN